MNITQEAFDEKLEEMLRRMEREGSLVTYIMSLGDVMSEISEDMNNRVLAELYPDEDDSDDSDDSEKDEP